MRIIIFLRPVRLDISAQEHLRLVIIYFNSISLNVIAKTQNYAVLYSKSRTVETKPVSSDLLCCRFSFLSVSGFLKRQFQNCFQILRIPLKHLP